MKKYISQPSSTLDGTYEVARWDEVKKEYIPIETKFPNEELSKERAHTLNKEYAQDLYEYEHQNEMISRAHDFVHSKEVQKQNSAEEFLARSKFQRDVCDEILEELKEEKKPIIKDIDFPLSALTIIKRSLESIIGNTTSDKTRTNVGSMLQKVMSILAGETQQFTVSELQDLNRCVITIYSHLVNTLQKGSLEDRHWLKVNTYLAQYAADSTVMYYNISLRK